MKKTIKTVVTFHAKPYEVYYTTEKEAEVEFLAYFLEAYKKYLYMFYIEAGEYYYEKYVKKAEFIEVVNTLHALATVIGYEFGEPLTKEVTFGEVYKATGLLKEFVEETFHLPLYCAHYGEVAHLCGYHIE